MLKIVNLRAHLHEVEGYSLDVGISTPLPPSVYGPSLSLLGTYYLEPSAPGSKIVKGSIGEIRVFGSSNEYQIEIDLDKPVVSLYNAKLQHIGDYDIPLTFQGSGSVLLLSYDELAHITPYSIAFYDANGNEVEQGGGWFDSLISDLIMWGLGKFIPFIPTSTLGTLLESEDEMLVPDILSNDITHDTKAVIIAPKKGGVKKAVVFIQKYADSTPDDDTLHLYATAQCSGCAEGLSLADYNPPTVVGTKYITDIPLENFEKTVPTTFTNTIGMEFVLIPAGEFEMGSPSDEEGRWSDEGPVHHVTIGNAFYMGRYEVTQEQWRAIMGDNPSYFTSYHNLPVECVSWDDVQDFIKKLNEKEGTTKYRLPSGAEWEYACRAGTTTRYSFGDDESELGDYAWYSYNSEHKTHPVGQKKANPWGLYDMHGNVWEWVQDCWHDSYNGAPADGRAWIVDCKNGGAFRVRRDGGWRRGPGSCRSASRDDFARGTCSDNLGFRLLREV
jgi:formylglycine-generating enzyme required for sulfatase activity